MNVLTDNYSVVRLDYGVKNCDGCFHRTHFFSGHRTLRGAVRSYLRHQLIYNCVAVVDTAGRQVDLFSLHAAEFNGLIERLNKLAA